MNRPFSDVPCCDMECWTTPPPSLNSPNVGILKIVEQRRELLQILCLHGLGHATMDDLVLLRVSKGNGVSASRVSSYNGCPLGLG